MDNVQDSDNYLWTLQYISLKHISISLTSIMGNPTLWDYCTILASSLNYRLPRNVSIAYILSPAPNSSPVSDESRKSYQMLICYIGTYVDDPQ
jgi:hypothetical protein